MPWTAESFQDSFGTLPHFRFRWKRQTESVIARESLFLFVLFERTHKSSLLGECLEATVPDLTARVDEVKINLLERAPLRLYEQGLTDEKTKLLTHFKNYKTPHPFKCLRQ